MLTCLTGHPSTVNPLLSPCGGRGAYFLETHLRVGGGGALSGLSESFEVDS